MVFIHIDIENFRGIKSLAMRDFGQVNLLVGKNNSGKTSVLEAVLAVSTPTALYYTSEVLRGEQEEQESYLFFRNANIDIVPRVTAWYPNPDDAYREIELEMTDVGILSKSKKEQIYRDFGTQNLDKFIECIVTESPSLKESPIPNPTRVSFDLNPYARHLGMRRVSGNVLTARRYDTGISKKISPLIIEKSMGGIISVLAKVDEKIAGIQLGLNDSVLFDIGLARLVPLHVMGDGMRQMLSILATIATSKEQIVVIDEIDNGLHYSTLAVLWEAVLKAAKEFNVQVFATTHSYECLAALAQVQEQDLFGEDSVRVFRLERDGEEHKAVKIDGENLRFMTQKGWEVR